MDRHITLPITKEIAESLTSGDYVYLDGQMYVARDAAHKRMMEVLDLHLPERADRSVPQDRQQPAVWINTHRAY